MNIGERNATKDGDEAAGLPTEADRCIARRLKGGRRGRG